MVEPAAWKIFFSFDYYCQDDVRLPLWALDEVGGLLGKVGADKNGLGQIMPNTKTNAPVGWPQAATGVNFGSYYVF